VRGRSGLWRYADEDITIGTGQAAVFEFVEMVEEDPPPR